MLAESSAATKVNADTRASGNGTVVVLAENVDHSVLLVLAETWAAQRSNRKLIEQVWRQL